MSTSNCGTEGRSSRAASGLIHTARTRWHGRPRKQAPAAAGTAGRQAPTSLNRTQMEGSTGALAAMYPNTQPFWISPSKVSACAGSPVCSSTEPARRESGTGGCFGLRSRAAASFKPSRKEQPATTDGSGGGGGAAAARRRQPPRIVCRLRTLWALGASEAKCNLPRAAQLGAGEADAVGCPNMDCTNRQGGGQECSTQPVGAQGQTHTHIVVGGATAGGAQLHGDGSIGMPAANKHSPSDRAKQQRQLQQLRAHGLLSWQWCFWGPLPLPGPWRCWVPGHMATPPVGRAGQAEAEAQARRPS
jgi:hypothetical protein